MNLYGYAGNSPTNFTDPSGLFFGYDDAIVLAGGALGGAISQFISNRATGHSGGYFSAIAGGAVASELTYLTGGNAFVGGAAGGFVTSVLKQEYEQDPCHPEEFSWTKVGESTGLGALENGLVAKIPGLSSMGQNSYDAIQKQILTKLANNTITQVSANTLGKIAVNQAVQAVVPGELGYFNDMVGL